VQYAVLKTKYIATPSFPQATSYCHFAVLLSSGMTVKLADALRTMELSVAQHFAVTYAVN